MAEQQSGCKVLRIGGPSQFGQLVYAPHSAAAIARSGVADADPQEVEPMKIRDIGVAATILGGRVTLTSETRTP